jgi:site-specific DNA-methyltransferase (adenine-specific)
MAVSPFTIASGQVPDVLATLAQLPNDEVFTPPTLVNAMLDVLPEEVWSNHTYRWLDPATKSGVFLRETYKRLMIGLAKWEPDSSLRREHILKNMLFGAAITSLASELSRRSVYQTTDATGKSIKDDSIKDLIVEFSSPEGNIVYAPTEHTIVKGKCTICRAPEKLIRDRRESFAYSFIHGTYPTKEMQDMKFDVIVGNPPYQIGMDDGQGNRTANITPLYNMFVDKAVAMNPRYVVMITPSRWFAGGHSLNEYRDRMIADRRLRAIVDYANAREVFPGVEVKGGVSYFLWDRDYDGDCSFTQMSDGHAVRTSKRDLRDGHGVVIRDNFAAEIVKKITSDPFEKGSLAERVSARDPFGQKIKTNFKDSAAEPFSESIPLVYVNKVGYIKPDVLERNHLWINKFKVLLPKASDGRGGADQLTVLGEPIALAPGSACTQSYLVAGTFELESEASNYAKFLTTKFVRFLVLQRKVSQDLTPTRFAFVPMMDMSKEWTDELLYKKFKLKPEEIAYIERAIGPRDWIDSLDSPVPATHLPGGRKYKAGDAPTESEDEDEDEDEE